MFVLVCNLSVYEASCAKLNSSKQRTSMSSYSGHLLSALANCLMPRVLWWSWFVRFTLATVR